MVTVILCRANFPFIWLTAVFERLRNILHNAEIDKRVQYMIEVMFAVRKDGFKVGIYIMVHF